MAEPPPGRPERSLPMSMPLPMPSSIVGSSRPRSSRASDLTTSAHNARPTLRTRRSSQTSSSSLLAANSDSAGSTSAPGPSSHRRVPSPSEYHRPARPLPPPPQSHPAAPSTSTSSSASTSHLRPHTRPPPQPHRDGPRDSVDNVSSRPPSYPHPPSWIVNTRRRPPGVRDGPASGPDTGLDSDGHVASHSHRNGQMRPHYQPRQLSGPDPDLHLTEGRNSQLDDSHNARQHVRLPQAPVGLPRPRPPRNHRSLFVNSPDSTSSSDRSDREDEGRTYNPPSPPDPRHSTRSDSPDLHTISDSTAEPHSDDSLLAAAEELLAQGLSTGVNTNTNSSSNSNFNSNSNSVAGTSQRNGPFGAHSRPAQPRSHSQNTITLSSPDMTPPGRNHAAAVSASPKPDAGAENKASKPAPPPFRINAACCPVCMDTPTHMTATSCGHVFCRDCLNEALRISYQMDDYNNGNPNVRAMGSCPVCRGKIDPLRGSKREHKLVPVLLMKRSSYKPPPNASLAAATGPAARGQRQPNPDSDSKKPASRKRSVTDDGVKRPTPKKTKAPSSHDNNPFVM